MDGLCICNAALRREEDDDDRDRDWAEFRSMQHLHFDCMPNNIDAVGREPR